MDLSPAMAVEKSDIQTDDLLRWILKDIFQLPSVRLRSISQDLQESAAFEPVTMYLTEDILLDFDPYLYALSGNNMQQYCTLQSWLEMRKHRSEVYLQTEGGVVTPLSLVHMEEEFNTSPSLYQGAGVAQTREQENVSLARLQYNFVPEANRPARSREFFLTGGANGLYTERPKTHPYAKGLITDFGTATAHQGGPLHVKTTYVPTFKHVGSGVVPQSREQNNPQHAVVAGESSPKEGHPSERPPPEKETHPGNNIEADVNPLPTSEVHEGTCGREVSPGGSNPAEKHSSPVPVPHQQQASLNGNQAFRCSKCNHPFECSAATLVGREAQAPNKKVKLPSTSKERGGQGAEKPFHCPDCGKGFLHQSSIPRHRRLHQREDSSPDSGKLMPNPFADPGTSFALTPLATKCPKLPGVDQPYKCSLCDKSYGQRYHLKRHEQQKHSVN